MEGECEIVACLVPLYWPAGLVCSIVICSVFLSKSHAAGAAGLDRMVIG